ncbi:unnamed protein product [Spodoptera littoralis]|uniref:Uncharacterized protein n=1 Tax=Spodoptera littoralis TaxID=7109 RepID=A0A9P0I6V2_SPOLI|nr:unnamed protein product [Spodoptera littoralis]CAH1640485.1 unnamed protein product [Spodoptera littoralis]
MTFKHELISDIDNDTLPKFDYFSQRGDITYSILRNKSYQNIFLVDTQNNEQSDTEQSIHILYILFISLHNFLIEVNTNRIKIGSTILQIMLLIQTDFLLC